MIILTLTSSFENQSQRGLYIRYNSRRILKPLFLNTEIRE